MNLLKFLVVLITSTMLCFPLLSQEESLDKFDRLYRVPADRSMYGQSVQQTEGGAYIVLTTVDTLDPAIPDITASNLTQFDAKGNVNWSVDYIMEDTLSLMPYGNVIIDSEGGYIFSAKSRLDASNANFIIRVDSQGGIIWSRKYASGDQADSVGRIDIINPNDSLIVMLGSTSLNGKIETKLTGIEEETGDIIWDKTITITGETNDTISPDVRNIGITRDSNIVITGSVVGEKYIFVNKHNQMTGNVIWSRKYEVPNVPDARLIANDIAIDVDSNLLITGLIDSDIIGNAAAGRSDVSDAYVVKLDREGILQWSRFFDFGESVVSSGTSIAVNEGGSPLVMIGGQNDIAGAFFPIHALIDPLGNLMYTRDYSIFLNSTGNNAEIISTSDNASAFIGTGIEHGINSPDGADLGFFYPRLIKTDLEGTTYCDTTISSSLVDFIINVDTLLWNVTDRQGSGGDTLEVEAFNFSGYTAPVLSLRDTMFCPGDPVSFILDATTRGAVGYRWFDAEEPETTLGDQPTFEATELEVQYVARVEVGEDLCYVMCDTTMLTEIMPPMVTLAPGLEQYCEDRSIGVAAQVMGGQITSVVWSTGEQNVPVIFPNDLGTYEITVTNTCGDVAEASITINESDLPQPQELVLISNNQGLCTTGNITITAQNQGLTGLLWFDNTQGQSVEVSEPGTYTLMATDFCGFEIDGSIEIREEDFLNPLSVSLENNTDNCSGGFVPIEANIEGNILLISWETADGMNVPNSIQVNPLLVDSAGTYSIRVVDICDNEIVEDIEVTNADLNDCGRTTDVCLEFPNAFIPSSELIMDDGSAPNRSFGPKNNCSNDEITTYDLRIFNRWGQQVFQSENVEDEWNGRKSTDPNSGEYPGDVYVFVAKYRTDSTDEIKVKGDLTLIR